MVATTDQLLPGCQTLQVELSVEDQGTRKASQTVVIVFNFFLILHLSSGVYTMTANVH